MVGRLYKGVGVGTFLHGFDLRVIGIQPKSPRPRAGSLMDVCQHIARGTTISPFLSFSRSYGIARDYAYDFSITPPGSSAYAHVYEIDIPADAKVRVIDPVVLIASQQTNPLISPSYHHDGDQSFLEYVVNPAVRLTSMPRSPRPPGMGASAPAKLEIEFEAIAFALRDAEILIEGNIHKDWVIHRHNVP
jgi:hypothetical protein